MEILKCMEAKRDICVILKRNIYGLVYFKRIL
jgi:hypothetical protein